MPQPVTRSRARRPSTRVRPVTLVVGDWLVDEYWFLVQHDSESSSHSGNVHYRVANQVAEGVADLCGAGHVARILVNLRERANEYKVCGIGDWHQSDTDLLKHLLHPRPDSGGSDAIDCDAVKAWYWYTPRLCDSPPDVDLISLHPRRTTTRVVRQYHHEHGGLEQINRIDWEPDDRGEAVTTDISALPSPQHVNRIVVHDFKKGVVTPDLVAALARRYPHAQWYVRSKQASPPWLDFIKHDLELIVAGPEISTNDNPWGSLLVNGTPSPSVLAKAAALPARMVVFLSNEREVVASARGLCVAGKSYLATPAVLQVRWISVFFGALVYFLSKNKGPKGCIEAALHAADASGTVSVPQAIGAPAALHRKADIRLSSWRQEDEMWAASRCFDSCGVIAADGVEELQVWRAAPYLPHYVAVIRKKQQILAQIGSVLREFKHGNFQRSVSILLQADPGSGKTFLARALADSFGFAFITADVSQMSHREELFALFDDIATQQANSAKRVFVFIDEFNSRLEGANVYGALLSPLEDGIFVSRGKRFSLRPCAWLFTGTTAAPEDGGASSEKLADLESRLTMRTRIDYAYLESEMERERGEGGKDELRQEASLEQVYLAATMIRGHFPDVHSVAYEVLQYFRDLKPDDGGAPRRVRRYVESMRDVQHGRITVANCKWMDTKSNPRRERMVRLVFH